MINPYDKQLPPEGDIYRREAISFGVSNDHILKTKNVFDTFQEAKAIKKLLNFKSNKIILVTSAYHMKRAKNLIVKENIDVVAYPVDFRSEIIDVDFLLNPLNWIPNSRNLSSSSSALRELIGRIAYKSFF